MFREFAAIAIYTEELYIICFHAKHQEQIPSLYQADKVLWGYKSSFHIN